MQQAENLRFLNEQLAHTNHELEEQKAEVEKKNEDIKASLNYAQRIQSAMLPDVQRMKQVFNDLFVLMMPRDIVSGDFYWYAEVRKHRLEEKMHHKIETRDVYETRNIQFAPDVREIQDFATVMGEDYVVPTGFQVLTRQTIITAADCTGHGVPGALMSMIGSNLLNEIVFMRGITEANEILSALSHGVRTFLKQDESKSKDGMDMALCMIDWDERKLYFSGAKNPLIYIQNGEVVEIKGDKKSIGGAATTTKEQKDGSSFALHTIDLKNTTHFYMMSDGYEDQFGGLEGKKFMRKNLRELILKIHNLSMSKQHQILKDNIIDWMKVGKQAQIDDILVVGFRIDELNPHK
jgi:serine phosphatase RsbU (regulator of sigma subunit)